MSIKDTDGWVRAFDVCDPQRHRKGFTVYKVISRVYHKSAADGVTEIVAFKRFSEFKRLHKSLSYLHQSLHLKGQFPAFPESKVFGRFDAQVIEARRQSALELLDFAAKHPTLFTSSVFVKFFDNSVTNFTAATARQPIDIDTPIDDEEVNGLPPPLEPSLSPGGDDWSDTVSDGSSYYSTPSHQPMDSEVRDQNVVSDKTQNVAESDSTNPTDSVITTTTTTTGDNIANTSVDESPPEVQCGDNSNEWFIHAIKSCDNQSTKECKPVTVSTTCDNSTTDEANVDFPEPFAQLMTKCDDVKTLDEIPNDVFAKQFSISCDESDHTLEAIDTSNDNPIPNPNSNPSRTADHRTDQSKDLAIDPPIVPSIALSFALPEVPSMDPSIEPPFDEPLDQPIGEPSVAQPTDPEPRDPTDTYLLDAAIILRQAQQHEECGEWEPAFESYKCAVGVLLQGVGDETDSEKKASIRRKTFQYLTRAEHIYDTYLSGTNSFQPSRRWAPDSPFKSLNATLVQSWFGSSQELSKFKVIGVDSKRVQIVIDTTTNNTFVIKVIYKSNMFDANTTTSSSTTASHRHLSVNSLSVAQSIFPNDIPFMVQIYRIFKTEYALFLLLEYARGGRLWDRISAVNGGRSFSPCPDCTFASDADAGFELIADNAYSGRRISRTRSECGSVGGLGGGDHYKTGRDTTGTFETISEQQVYRKSESMDSECSPSGSLASIESIDCDAPSKSYLSLCNHYALEQQKCPQSTLLADCQLGSMDSIDSIDSITEYESKQPYELSTNKSGCGGGGLWGRPPQRQASTESLGISGLLARARGILKNVDQTLNITKYMTKTVATNMANRVHDLRSSKSEMTLNQFSAKTIEEVFHERDDGDEDTTTTCCTNRPLVPEREAKRWLSQILRCLQHLHKLGAIYVDLKPENILLDEDSNVCVSYKCFWSESHVHVIDEWARERLYVAPELIKSGAKVSHLCDWWSFGVIAFELLTARSLVSYYPNGITSHTSLYFPVFISLEAKDLINKLLQPNPSERLGRHGSEEITTHPFFEGINWTNS